MGVGYARSRYLNRKERDAKSRASDWSEVDPGGSGEGGDHRGSSFLENPYIPYQCMDSYLSSTGLEKVAINRISLILPSRKKEREILFPFRRDQEIGSSRKKNAWYK
ncbi:hypothetical protein ACSBR2_006190 [Camellia fascicularis]